jgi:hypothetical protein
VLGLLRRELPRRRLLLVLRYVSVYDDDEDSADVVVQAKGVVKKVEGAITGNAAKKVCCFPSVDLEEARVKCLAVA